jgi:peptidoglycan hydrolase-like protein with peptidoglycan-binding domain
MRKTIARVVGLTAAMLCAVPVVIVSGGAAHASTPACTDWAGYVWGSNSNGNIIVRTPSSEDYSPNCVMSTSNIYNQGAYALQIALVECYGKKIDEDGYFGASTKSALKAVQKSVGVTVDGVYGPQTGKAIKWDLYYSETAKDPGKTYGCHTAAGIF